MRARSLPPRAFSDARAQARALPVKKIKSMGENVAPNTLLAVREQSPCHLEPRRQVELVIVIKADDEAKLAESEAAAEAQRSRTSALEEQIVSLQRQVSINLRCKVAKQLRKQLAEAEEVNLRQVTNLQQRLDLQHQLKALTTQQLDRATEEAEALQAQLNGVTKRLQGLLRVVVQYEQAASAALLRSSRRSRLFRWVCAGFLLCYAAHVRLERVHVLFEDNGTFRTDHAFADHSDPSHLSERNGTDCQLLDVQALLDARVAHAVRLEGLE